jgi:hypothetical protein
MRVELASLIHLLGGMAPKHLVAVGGLVPPLLVPEPRTPHRGSADIDLSVSLAITKGETSEYYRSLEAAIEPFFEPFEAGFRWRKRDGVAGVRPRRRLRPGSPIAPRSKTSISRRAWTSSRRPSRSPRTSGRADTPRK